MAIFLILVFLVLPLAELYVIIQVGQAIGVLPTLAILFLDGFVGAYLARSQGRAVWDRFNSQMAAGRVPAREIADGAMIILGGALLLSPGFITDVFGILLILPPTRALWRGLLRRLAGRHPAGKPVFFIYDRVGPSRRGRGAADGPGTGPQAASPPPRRPQRAGSYDVEGTAHEIPEEERHLPRGPSDDPAGRAGDA